VTPVVSYYHLDALGSVRAITDATGAVVERHDFRPFGEDTQTLPAEGADPLRFIGEPRDQTKLDLFGARYYSMFRGRFNTADPAHADASLVSPQGWNAYAYARNNPFRFADPSGLTPYQKPDCPPGAFCGGTDMPYLPPPSIPSPLDPCAPTIFSLRATLALPPGCGGRSGGDVGGGNVGSGDQASSTVPPKPPVQPKPPGTPKPPDTPQSPKNCDSDQSKGSSIVSASITSGTPTALLGGIVGAAVAGPLGALVGGLIGGDVGVGGTLSYVPSTGSLYAGPTVGGGVGVMTGWSVGGTWVSVPPGQNANSIVKGLSFTGTFQPLIPLGSAVVKTPGAGDPVVGFSVGTRMTLGGNASYSICLMHCGC
jgi:RHS repeat-associated protein